MNLLLTSIALATALAASPLLAATVGVEKPSNTPAKVASLGNTCQRVWTEFQSALEPKAFAQSEDGRSCGHVHQSASNRDSVQPITHFEWAEFHAAAIRHCEKHTNGKPCFVTATNKNTWATWITPEEWRAAQIAARPTVTPTSFSNTDEGAGGRYIGKVSTKNTTTNEPWERPISFSIGANSFAGQPDNAPNVKIEGGILPGGKVQGTLYGGKTNYAIEGQVTKMADGKRVFRATLRPLEPSVTITGTIEAVAEAEGAPGTTAPSNLYVIPPKQ